MTRELAKLPVPLAAEQSCVIGLGTASDPWQLAWLVGNQKVPTGITFESNREAARASLSINERIWRQ